MGRPLTLRDVALLLLVDVPHCHLKVFGTHKNNEETATGVEDEDRAAGGDSNSGEVGFPMRPCGIGPSLERGSDRGGVFVVDIKHSPNSHYGVGL